MIEKHTAAKKSTLVSVFVNLCLGTFQIVTGFFSGSQGLIADGIHSFSDLVSDIVVLIANKHSSKDPDEDHHYGHYRYETAATAFIGLSLIGVGILMIWHAGYKIAYSDEIVEIKIIALWVALGALVIKELLFRYMLHVGEQVKSAMLIANSWHARSDAASSFVVAIGIVGALFGYGVFDIIAALVVGLMIVKMGWDFSWDALHDLMDRSVSLEEDKKITNIILETKGVKGIHDLKTRKMGDMILVDVHIEVDANISVREGHDIAVAARLAVMTSMPAVLNVMSHVDPV
ncbi:MAG: cation diffusion facilitator family transporter [Proteobacteria bacterium]|jgi:cation diffusion facilitator family transporter|nr:cation diffusion facilitator family transporter [Pseudomonadota bacterium]